jgi:hypothetical protein
MDDKSKLNLNTKYSTFFYFLEILFFVSLTILRKEIQRNCVQKYKFIFKSEEISRLRHDSTQTAPVYDLYGIVLDPETSWLRCYGTAQHRAGGPLQ